MLIPKCWVVQASLFSSCEEGGEVIYLWQNFSKVEQNLPSSFLLFFFTVIILLKLMFWFPSKMCVVCEYIYEGASKRPWEME